MVKGKSFDKQGMLTADFQEVRSQMLELFFDQPAERNCQLHFSQALLDGHFPDTSDAQE